MEAKDKCDITISIDCDGQDDISVMTEMVKAYFDGSEVVYGVRNNRETDTFFKRTTAQAFYKLLNGLGAEVVYNHYVTWGGNLINGLDYLSLLLFLRSRAVPVKVKDLYLRLLWLEIPHQV